MFWQKLLAALLILGLAELPQLAQAHSLVKIFSQYLGDKVAVVNYNVDHFQTGLPVNFNIRLYQIANGAPVPFDHAKVSFLTDQKTQHSQLLAISQNQDINYSYTFPKTGQYKLDVEYIKGSQVVATADFPLIVEPGVEKLPQDRWWIYLLAGTALGVVLTRLSIMFNLGQKLVKFRPAIGFSVLKLKR